MKNILIENVTVRNSECPIFIRLGARMRKIRGEEKKYPAGPIDGITIRNLKAKTKQQPFRAILMAGIEGHRVRNVLLENIEIDFRTLSGDITPPGKKTGENNGGYPASTMFKHLSSWGVFERHAENITLKNVKLTSLADRDPARMEYFEDVHGLKRE